MKRFLFVAAFVATSSAAHAQAQAVTVTLSEWKVALARDTVKAGSVTFTIKNTGSMAHGFYVRGPGLAKGSPDVAARQETSLTVNLKAGVYEVYCPMSDNSHKMAGMTHTLVVTGGAAPAPAKKPGA